MRIKGSGAPGVARGDTRHPARRGQVGLDQASAYRYAVHVMATAATTPDAQEGIAAFLEKRPPVFGQAT